MKIRDEQLEAFTEARVASFEQYMYDHLRKWIPGECAELGEEGVRQRVRDGVERAARYDVLGQRDMARFIDLMFVLGPRFDRDSRHRWAGDILADKTLTPTKKVDRLCTEANRRRGRGRRR